MSWLRALCKKRGWKILSKKESDADPLSRKLDAFDRKLSKLRGPKRAALLRSVGFTS
jgi:hypothetical protein